MGDRDPRRWGPSLPFPLSLLPSTSLLLSPFPSLSPSFSLSLSSFLLVSFFPFFSLSTIPRSVARARLCVCDRSVAHARLCACDST